MTTPPKVRRFHLSRAESPVAAARIAATGKASGPAEAMPKVRVEVHRRTQPESGAAAPDGPSNVQGVPEDLFAPSPDDDGFAGMHFPGGVAAAERPADNASA
ncbi:MAG TPA: hypothetical protein PLL33_07725, partial [Paracoccus sp. (in: a-proteobacteria)]|nr:hypothetical protein [Paracoccus sp. (in: a-proteobacteria)]